VTTGEQAYLDAMLGSPLRGDTNAVFPRGGMGWGPTAGLGALSSRRRGRAPYGLPLTAGYV
jgi:endoglucanase